MFTDFMASAHEMHSFDMTYVEYIRNPVVLQWCIKRGWAPYNPYERESIENFYLLKHSPSQEQVAFTSLEASILSKSIEEVLLTQNNRPGGVMSTNADAIMLQVLQNKLHNLERRHYGNPDKTILQEIVS